MVNFEYGRESYSIQFELSNNYLIQFEMEKTLFAQH